MDNLQHYIITIISNNEEVSTEDIQKAIQREFSYSDVYVKKIN